MDFLVHFTWGMVGYENKNLKTGQELAQQLAMIHGCIRL